MLSLTLRQLEYATAVGRHGGVTAAAEALHVSQPALSVSLAQLEALLGRPLFLRRAGGRLTPTAFGRGWLDEAEAQLAALALVEAKAIGKNEKWLDLCAGPGGKAALLAAEANVNGAELTCNELAPHRAKLVRQALSVIDSNIRVTVEDGRTYANNHSAAFDRILLDAPCTGLGALRRRPESRWRKAQSDVAELSHLQEELLQSAWDCLKPGGVLAYVTCSPHLAETNAIVDWAKKKLTGIELLDANSVLASINSNLHLNRGRKTVQLWPHIHQTDAMFIALLTKTSN